MASSAPEAFELPEAVRAETAAAVRLAGERFLDEAPADAQIQLARLDESNSIVVALLLAWVRYARARNKSIRFVDVPADLRSIIELYGVTDILPLDGGGARNAWSIDDEAGTQSGGGDGPGAGTLTS